MENIAAPICGCKQRGAEDRKQPMGRQALGAARTP